MLSQNQKNHLKKKPNYYKEKPTCPTVFNIEW